MAFTILNASHTGGRRTPGGNPSKRGGGTGRPSTRLAPGAPKLGKQSSGAGGSSRGGSSSGGKDIKPSPGSSEGVAQQRATTAARSAVKLALGRIAALPDTDIAEYDHMRYIDAVMSLRQESSNEGGEESDGVQVTGRKGKPRSRGARKVPLYKLIASHQQVFRRALVAELKEEWEESEARLTEWSRARLQEEGAALFGLKGAPDGSLFKDNIVRFALPGRDEPLPFHSFSQGDIVLISRGNPGDDSLEGIVMDWSAQWVRLAVPANIATFVVGGPFRLDLYANTTAHERCMAALAAFAEAPDMTTPEGRLHRVLLSDHRTAADLEAAAAMAPPWMTDVKAGRERTLEAITALQNQSPERMNDSQVAAVVASLRRTLTLIQGPPGTGKTRTLARLLAAATHVMPRGQILAAAASNVAVDNLVTKLLELGVKVIRVGQPVKVAKSLLDVTLEGAMAQTKNGAAAIALRASIRNLKGPQAKAAWEQATRLEQDAAEEVLAGAQVVAATCIGAADPRMAGRKFRMVVLDEATQAAEPASLVALLMGAESAVLVGDPRQLPPTVKSPPALESGLDVSLFDRLNILGIKPLLLSVQYRMHPALAGFPSAVFYGGRLLSHPRPADRLAPSGVWWPNRDAPIMFLESDAPEARSGSGGTSSTTSWLNTGEARLAVELVSRILGAGGVAGPQDIGVITPYSGQVRELRDLMQRKFNGTDSWAQLEIKSVDGFQGREKEVIVFSAVRSNTRGSVGFLSDARRLNVAITRAKRGLIVIGNRATLSNDPFWRSWIAWIDSHGLAAPADLIAPGYMNGLLDVEKARVEA